MTITEAMATRWRYPLQQVLDISELFELILLQLDIRTLLSSAQRVSRSWKTFIQQSPALQRHLCFFPDNHVYSEHREDGRTHGHNSLLIELFPLCFAGGGTLLAREKDYVQQPFARNLAAFMRPGASWRRMLVQLRPSITHVGMWQSVHSWRGSLRVDVKIDACRIPRLRQPAVTEPTIAEGVSDDEPVEEEKVEEEEEQETQDAENPHLRMGALYDLITPCAFSYTQDTRLYWTGSSITDREAFCAIRDVDTSNRAHATAETLAERERFGVVCSEQRRKLADSAGLIVFVSKSRGWCGTNDEIGEELTPLFRSFLHPDGPLARGGPGPRQFETLYEWKDRAESSGWNNGMLT